MSNHNGNNNYSARDVFGETLRARRIAKNLTQEEMAELLGVGLATISAWELGRYSPRENNLDKIEELLGQLDEVVTTSKSEVGLPPQSCAVKRADVETAIGLSQGIEELLVTAAGFTEDPKLENFLGILLNKARRLNATLISIKAGLRD